MWGYAGEKNILQYRGSSSHPVWTYLFFMQLLQIYTLNCLLATLGVIEWVRASMALSLQVVSAVSYPGGN